LAARAATWLSWLAAALDLAFLAGLGLALWRAANAQPNILLFGLPAGAAPLFALPWLAAILAAGALVLTGLSWKRRESSPGLRGVWLLVPLASLALAGLLVTAGVL
jgi:hypothetical protein